MTPENAHGGFQISKALMAALMVAVTDEGGDMCFGIAGQEVVVQQDSVLMCVMPALDLFPREICWPSTGRRLHPNGLCLQVLLKRFRPIVTGERPGLLVTSKRGLDVALGKPIDRNRATRQRASHVKGPVDVLGEHGCVQTIICVTGNGQSFLGTFHGHDAQNGSKNLFARNFHFWGDALKNRWFNVVCQKGEI